MRTNTIHHANFLDNDLPDGCAKLIISDPPYFEVKGKFDFIWESFDAYLLDVEKWVKECARLLADNGTLFWWGMDRKIAYSQIVLDKYLTLLSTLIWEKPSNPNEWDTRRTFPERGAERLLMYSREEDETGLERLMEEHIKPKHPFAKYLRAEFKRAGVTGREIAQLFPSKTGGLTGCVSNWLNGDNVMTEPQYLKVREYLNGEYLRKEYDVLRKKYDPIYYNEYEAFKKKHESKIKEYEEQRRYFNNYAGHWDILRYSREKSKYNHPTQKPEKLTRMLINTTTRKGDLVIIPFAGSGTECAMAADLQRPFIGYDIDEKHVNTARKRCDYILKAPKLF